MIRRAGRLRGGEDGQTVVLLAVAMPLFLALLLVVIDGGRLYVERERLIAAARLSAQAGTSALVDGLAGGRTPTDEQIRAVVDEAISRNLPGETVRSTVDIDRSKLAVSVRLEQQIDAFLGRVSITVAGSFSTRTSRSPSASDLTLRSPIQSRSPVPIAEASPQSPCYRTKLGPFYLPGGYVASRILVDGVVAPDGVFFAGPASAHRTSIDAESGGNRRTFEGVLTLQGQAIAAAGPVLLYGGASGILGRYASTWGAFAQCP